MWQDLPRPGHPAVREEDVQTVNTLVLADQNVMIRELANDAGLAPLTVLNILKKLLGMQKIISRWLQYNAACTHLEHYKRRIIVIDKIWPELMNHSWNANQASGVIMGHHEK